jgi:Fe-S-cluster containining protein
LENPWSCVEAMSIRAKLKPGEVLCDYCTGQCCRYFALPIDKPTSWEEFEFCRWYLYHEGATIFSEDDTWYLCVHSKCQHLGDDNRCGVYLRRPQICREYTTDNCEFDNYTTYERYFENGDQIYEYAETILGPRTGGSRRSDPPPVLPVMG